MNESVETKKLPYEKDFCVRRGEDFAYNLSWKPNGVISNLSGYRAYMDIKDVIGGVVVESLSTNVDAFQEIQTGLFNDAFTQWNIQIKLPAARTKVIPPGEYAYDLVLINPAPSTDSTYFLKGNIIFSQEVTTNPLV